jgi:ribosomal protein S18 acetylase RimI-like enzyme
VGRTAAGFERCSGLNTAACRVGIEVLAHRERWVAARIELVIALARAQEAQLLQVADFPQPARTASDIATDGDFYLGALRDSDLVGVLSVGPDDEARQLRIQVLAVHPAAQRQGIGRLLVQSALNRLPGAAFAVATPAGNAPALALYQGLGFVPYRSGVIGPNDLPLVKLRRSPQPRATAASKG